MNLAVYELQYLFSKMRIRKVADNTPIVDDQELALIANALSEIWSISVNNGSNKEILNVLFRPDLIAVQQKLVKITSFELYVKSC